MPIVEARIKSLPVVSSDVADMRELLANDPGTVFVDDPRDTGAYVRHISSVFSAGSPKIECPVTDLLSTATEAKKYERFFQEIANHAE